MGSARTFETLKNILKVVQPYSLIHHNSSNHLVFTLSATINWDANVEIVKEYPKFISLFIWNETYLAFIIFHVRPFRCNLY